jgi:hypothetical protein
MLDGRRSRAARKLLVGRYEPSWMTRRVSEVVVYRGNAA